ncbi:EpsD family peptidyl-prolyl cis-trans isomerase [Duganella sp. BJB1802]|uniref:EpsD family peptidyl-prolyl cis-trans isomerase n=1 Tax=Duganella sp. BJB1802 TaxID=2744575 RepID=UPI001C3CED4E|nr:EpsD family peptidyl-prolyl cis-trans isomerase [Duganella sp. BJB1802]
MNQINKAGFSLTAARRPVLVLALVAAGLAGCGGKESKPGQALASVNGEEVTVLQLNEELQRANVPQAQQAAAGKQLLESLIDRQLVLNQALQDKVERDPKVVQAIERAKALIIAQAYMQKKIGAPAKPAKAEVEQYFSQHPEFFSNRKQFELRQLVLASKELDPQLKAAIDGAKTLDEAAAWMDQHQVKYVRAQLSRNSAELAPELSAKLLSLPKGALFIIREGERSVLVTIAEVRDAPVTLEQATPQIEQFLFNKKNKEVADAELKRLRAAAKIVYLNGNAPAEQPKADKDGAKAPAADASKDDTQARGVAGLK